MKLYTLQHKSVYYELLKTGVYKTNTQFICEETYLEAYTWMSSMAKKFKGWSCPRPVWCWTKRPDMRKERFFTDSTKAKEEPYVLLTLEVPEALALVSEFSLWHHVLNKYPLSCSQTEEEAWEKRLETPNFDTSTVKKDIEKSWEQIFNLGENSFKHMDLEAFNPEHALFQAIIPEIQAKYIKKVEFFTLINQSVK